MIVRPHPPVASLPSIASCLLITAVGCTDLDLAMPMARLQASPDDSARVSDDAGARVEPSPVSSPDSTEWVEGLGLVERISSLDRFGRSSPPAVNGPELGPEESSARILIEASLSADDEGLRVTLRNDTKLAANVALNLRLDTPEGSYVYPAAGDVLLSGEEQRDFPFAESDFQGSFDITTLEWSRTVLQYDFALQDGRRGSRSTELASHGDTVLSAAEAILSHRRLPDLTLASEAVGDAQPSGIAFSACFMNVIDLRPQWSGETPTACPPGGKETPGGCLEGLDFLIQNHQVLPLPGQTFAYVAPNGATGAGNLDVSGCTPSLPVQPGDWTFTIYLHTQRQSPARAVYFLDDKGHLAFVEQKVSVKSTGGRSTFAVQMHDRDGSFQAAVLLASNTLDRANEIRALPAHTNNVLRISPSSSEAAAKYCHVAGDECVGPLTLRVAPSVANDRGLIAHETGHFIHAQQLDCTGCIGRSPPFVIDYEYTDADALAILLGEVAQLPPDTCRRTASGYDMSSIEWQSAAHWEGLADFFVALSYNEHAFGDSDCQFPRLAGDPANVTLIDCEAPGRTPLACIEWKEVAVFDVTGNALDWTKMYWDFLTNYYVKDWSTYFQAERNASWPPDGRGNHFDRIWRELEALDVPQGNDLYDSTAGNNLNGDGQ